MRGAGLDLVWAALPEARIVGGAVRDALLGRESADIDMASPLPPGVVMARAGLAGLKAVPTGIAHGTVTVVAAGKGFEVTTLRRDVATDGRHAVVEFTDDWRADAARRDFTINAMSMDQEGRVFDYFGGRDDLAAGRVRFVGGAAARICEDYLRVLRYFRFFARYGRGAPDPEALAAIGANRAGVAGLSAERVWHELKLILQAPLPCAAVRLMAESGVLGLVWPEAVPARLEALARDNAPVAPLLRVAALGVGDVGAFAARLRLSGAEAARLRAYVAPNGLAPGDDDDTVRRALCDDPAEVLAARTWLAGGGGPAWDGLRARLAALPRPVLPLQGRDLLALGVRPGPELGRVLRGVEAWWRTGGCVAERAACLDEARGLMERFQASPRE
ncbi:CCA tRNA nucleotidyltransferase [Acidocella sp.]|uniref:CCA tRNA nucleotidyltransferase n=1 Tax=Acidocella sp. TaxID=50710 RepID=UPI00261A88F5|nr:CCA tRNA nucleotidyltransferase [Acidocella sp.]